jgi:hypothetical protein
MDSPIILSLHVAYAIGLPTVANVKTSKCCSVSRYEIIPLGARFLWSSRQPPDAAGPLSSSPWHFEPWSSASERGLEMCCDSYSSSLNWSMRVVSRSHNGTDSYAQRSVDSLAWPHRTGEVFSPNVHRHISCSEHRESRTLTL